MNDPKPQSDKFRELERDEGEAAFHEKAGKVTTPPKLDGKSESE